MKLLLGILALILAAVSLIADYKWRQWIAARKRDRDLERDRERDQNYSPRP